MSDDAIKAFRDLFLLNPAIQRELKGATSPKNFLNKAVAIGARFGLVFTSTELRKAITNFHRNKAEESPACIAMGRTSVLPPNPTSPDADVVIKHTLTILNSPSGGPDEEVCRW